LQNRDILILASAPWVTEGPLNCHHIARRLAAKNRVLFVESSGLRTPSPFHKADVLKALGRLRGWLSGLSRGPREATENLHVLSPAALPFHGRSRLARWNAALLGRACARAAETLGFTRPILWAFLPTAVQLLGRLNESAVVYHCVDDYAGNPGVNAQAIEEQERQLAAAADICFGTSQPLASRLAAMTDRVVCVPNVAEVERFQLPPPERPAELERLPRPLIGYVGNLASYKVDFGLLATLGARRPQWSVALVGPVGGGDPSTKMGALRQHENIHVLGPKPYDQIPAYVHSFDVCVIPFRRSRVTDCSLPLKTFECLAAGKPVVSRPLPALTAEPLADVIRYAETAEEFVAAIEAALAEDSEEAARARRAAAERYSWEKRFPEIEAHVAEAIARKQSASDP